MAEDRSHVEVDATAADYFAMLRLQLLGESYNKSEHRRRLLPHLKGRTHASIEWKHENISAVLIEMGIPPIDGYKPAKNYQRGLLPDAVRAYLAGHPELLVESGIFSVVRHPIYSGLSLAAFGWSLIWNSIAALVVAFLLLAFFDIKARREERWLEEKFPGYGPVI